MFGKKNKNSSVFGEIDVALSEIILIRSFFQKNFVYCELNHEVMK